MYGLHLDLRIDSIVQFDLLEKILALVFHYACKWNRFIYIHYFNNGYFKINFFIKHSRNFIGFPPFIAITFPMISGGKSGYNHNGKNHC